MKKIIIFLLLFLTVNIFTNEESKLYCFNGKKILRVRKPTSNILIDAEKDKTIFLEIHNAARKEVGCPPLEWDENLAKYAEEWANYLISIKKIKHRNTFEYGENIFWGSGETYTLVDAAKMWFKEKKKFKGRKYKPQCGHYTQMIWRNTIKVGAAIIRKNGITICVANYSPPGNDTNENVY